MPTLVMIHGLFGHLRVPEIEGALEEFDVSAPDLIGYGTCREADTDALTLAAQVERVVAHVEGLRAGRVHLLGHSVGGAVAMLVARERPDLLASLTSVEGNFTLEDAFWSAKIAGMASDLPVHLIAGARSADGWDVPGWANDLCAVRVNVPDAGHLMMVERPRAFARAVAGAIGLGEVVR